MVAWGSNDSGQATVPSGLSNVVAIAAGGGHSLALVGLPPGVAVPAGAGPRFLVATVDRAFHHRIIAKNGVDAYGAVGLPPGLVLDPDTGLITGLPMQAGTYSVVLSATNSVGSSAWTVTLFVNLPLPAIASSGLVLPVLGSAFNYAVVAYNAPEWYGAGGLPPGLVIDAQTGLISGVPVEFGDFDVSLVASNRYGLDTGSLTLRVSPVVGWGSGPTVPSGLSNVVAIAAGANHSLALTAEGRPVQWPDSPDYPVPGGLSNVVAIATGDGHSLALTAEGRVVGWGWNGYGQTNVPSGLGNVVAIATGYAHSLALTAEGRVVAWGSYNNGKDLVPMTVPSGLSNVVAIAAGVGWGGNHSLALTAEGRVVAWGAGTNNTGSWPQYGQSQVPSGLSNVVAIAAGGAHSLALTAEGRVVGWGDNSRGQATVPSGLSNVVAIAAAGAFVGMGGPYGCSLALSGLPPGVGAPACAGPRLLVATADRAFHHRILGKNGVDAYGAVGLPSGLVLDPETGLITGLPAQAGKYSVVLSATNSVGSSAWTVTLFVNESAAPAILSSGLVLAGLGSGFNYAVDTYYVPEWYGATGLPVGLAIDAQSGVISGVPVELGDFVISLVASNRSGLATGSLTLRVSPVVGWGYNGEGQTTVPSGLSNVVAIAAWGEQWSGYSLALTAEGRVVGWGMRYNGSNSWVSITVPSGLSNVVGVATGGDHSLALTAEGRVVGWDYNGSGQTDAPGWLSNVVAIAAGYAQSLALTAEGQVVQWPGSAVPSGLSNVVAIAAGSYHSLALTAEGRVVGWGANWFGETDVPSGLSNVVAIAAGGQHSLALTAEGRVVAWGAGGPGTSGDLNYGQATVPSGLSNVVAIAAGYAHSLALTAEGTVAAWGSYLYEFDAGWPLYAPMTVPSGLSNVVAIAAGGYHSLALSGLPPGVAAPARVGPRFLVATADRAFHHRIIAKNGAIAYGAAGLPPGLVLDPDTGLITGLPTQAGTYSVGLSATNSAGSSAWTVTLFVNEPAAPGIPGGLVPAGLGSGFSHAMVVYNAPEWYGASGLPGGLIIDAQTGVISGVPAELGDFVVSLVASNRYGLGTGSLTLRVSPVVAWGLNGDGQTDVPSGLSNVVAIAAGVGWGGNHSLALTAEGRVVAWGAGAPGTSDYPNYGQTTVPSGLSNVVAIAAGSFHSLALTAEGWVVAWGHNRFGQTTVPNWLSNVVGIAAGAYYSLALTTEGQVVGWGETTLPSGLSNVVAIAPGLALTAEGQVVAWGGTTVPSGLSNVVGIAAGEGFSLTLTAEGTVAAWGSHTYGYDEKGNSLYAPMTVPSGLSNVVGIAAGADHSLALTAEGRVVGWGAGGPGTSDYPNYGQATVPNWLSNVVGIAAGSRHSLALLQQPTVPTPRLELSRAMSGLELQAHGAPGISCQLLRASRLPGPWLPAEPVTFTNNAQLLRAPDTSEPAQFYRLLRK